MMNKEIHSKIPGVVMVEMSEELFGRQVFLHIWFTNGFDEKYSVLPNVRSFILEEMKTYWKNSTTNKDTLIEFGHGSGVFLCRAKDILRIS